MSRFKPRLITLWRERRINRFVIAALVIVAYTAAIGQIIHYHIDRAEQPARVDYMTERNFNPLPVNAGGLPPERSMTSKDAVIAESVDMKISTSDSSSDEPAANDSPTPPPKMAIPMKTTSN